MTLDPSIKTFSPSQLLEALKEGDDTALLFFRDQKQLCQGLFQVLFETVILVDDEDKVHQVRLDQTCPEMNTFRQRMAAKQKEQQLAENKGSFWNKN